MKNTIALEHKHIRDLLNQDNTNMRTINGFYESALRIIDSHINDFYNQYATDNGLTLAQVQGMATHWDINQYEQAINELTGNLIPNDQLSSRLQAANAKATTSKKNVIGSIIGAGLAIATAKIQNYGNKELPKQYLREYNYRSPNNETMADIPENTVKQSDFNHRIWSHNDEMTLRTQEQLNKSIQKGLNGNSIQRLTNVQPESNKRLSDNLSSQANSMVSRVQLTFKVHSIKNTEQGKRDAYDTNDTDNDYMKWITQRDSKVCPVCEDLDGQIFTVDDCPTPEIDTHLGCRCQPIECDKNGNLSSVYP